MYHEIVNDQLLTFWNYYTFRNFLERIYLYYEIRKSWSKKWRFIRDRATIKFRIRFVQASIRLAGDPRHLTPLLSNNLFQASRDDQEDFLAAVENGKQSMKIVEYGRANSLSAISFCIDFRNRFDFSIEKSNLEIIRKFLNTRVYIIFLEKILEI